MYMEEVTADDIRLALIPLSNKSESCLLYTSYGEYRQARAAMRELLTVKNNVDRVLAMEQTEPQQKEKDHGQR